MVIQILAALTAAVCSGLKSPRACLMLSVVSPSENSAEQGGVQALGGRESPLDLRHRDLTTDTRVRRLIGEVVQS